MPDIRHILTAWSNTNAALFYSAIAMRCVDCHKIKILNTITNQEVYFYITNIFIKIII